MGEDLASSNVNRTYSLAATTIAIFTFMLIFLYPRFASGEINALLFQATLVVMGVATFSFGSADLSLAQVAVELFQDSIVDVNGTEVLALADLRAHGQKAVGEVAVRAARTLSGTLPPLTSRRRLLPMRSAYTRFRRTSSRVA